MATTLIRRNMPVVWCLAVVALMFAVATLKAPHFATFGNVQSLATQASFIGVVAIGQTIVILTGGVDLSVPWVMASGALLVATLSGGHSDALIWALPLGTAFGAAVGVCNGVGIAVFGVSPIIMTLAVNTILSGASTAINPSLSATLPSTVNQLASHHVGPFSVDVLIWIALGAVAMTALMATTFGRRIYAIGTSARVARFAGLNTTATQIAAYAISGVTAVWGGIMLGGYSGQVYGGLGDPYLFASVAAVALGGASIYGGRGNYAGTMAGALVLTMLAAVLPVLGFSPAALGIGYGVVILVTVSLARMRGDGRSAS